MDSISNWFQDWSDACEYAKECSPDLSFVTPREPLSALITIAAACFAIWAWNEWRIKKRWLQGAAAKADAPLLELQQVLEQLRSADPKPKEAKRAA